MEPLSAVCLVIGVVLLVISWLLLLQVSFDSDYSWGLATLFLPPLAYLYGLFRWNRAGEAILVSLVGWVLVLLALG